jgi:hypothetical protein
MSDDKNKKIKIISQCKMIKMTKKKNKLISQCQIIKIKIKKILKRI